MENTYFDQESYENDIALEVNQDVLKRIYSDGILEEDILPIEFYFLTDSEDKTHKLEKHILLNYPEYTSLQILDYQGDTELRGITQPIKMSLDAVNHWNIVMWNLGYEFDCKLDGWQVKTS